MGVDDAKKNVWAVPGESPLTDGEGALKNARTGRATVDPRLRKKNQGVNQVANLREPDEDPYQNIGLKKSNAEDDFQLSPIQI